MVQIQLRKSRHRSSKSLLYLTFFSLTVGGMFICLYHRDGIIRELVHDEYQSITNTVKSQLRPIDGGTNNPASSLLQTNTELEHLSSVSQEEVDTNSNDVISIPCGYKRFSDLKEYETNPKVTKNLDGNNRRHAYDPPKDGIVTLVCCDTTAGPLSVAVHENWAKLGAERFLDMVKTNYFSSKVALMRCIKNFICQFGLAGDPKLNRQYGSFPDDPNWLKEGKQYRTNTETGAFRYARGYFAYAGSGKNSRGNQLIVALGDNKMLGGGSPWEVPFGEVVGEDSYNTLAKISTVYGEKGPSQPLLFREGSSSNVAEKFPMLDYVTSCIVVDSKDFGSKP